MVLKNTILHFCPIAKIHWRWWYNRLEDQFLFAVDVLHDGVEWTTMPSRCVDIMYSRWPSRYWSGQGRHHKIHQESGVVSWYYRHINQRLVESIIERKENNIFLVMKVTIEWTFCFSTCVCISEVKLNWFYFTLCNLSINLNIFSIDLRTYNIYHILG